MTNQSLRKRFGLADGSSSAVSQIISATIEQGWIKLDPNASNSKKFARYLPAWA
jgi:ATP-dependent DNA helicase RecG